MIRSAFTLVVFVSVLVLISAKLYSRKIDFTKEPVYDMSVYYEKYPRGMVGCGVTGSPNEMNARYRPVAGGPDGKSLFKANCASCHKSSQVLIGPALMDAKQRWADAGIPDKMYDWVRNPKKVLDEGHPYVKELVKKFSSQALMTPQDLTNEQIDAVLNYMGPAY